MAFTDIWDVTQPPDTQLANLLGQDIRNFRLDTQQRMAAISGISTMKPNFAGDAQPANWTGVLFFATDNGHIYQFNGAIWVDITTLFLAPSTTYKNASAAVGVSIPGNTLAVGSIIRGAFQIAQAPGAAGSNMLFAGSLTNLFGPNGSGGTFNWYIFFEFFVTAIGAAGNIGGQFSAAAFNGSSYALPIQDLAVNTTNPIGTSVQLGAGCTAGNISEHVTI